MNYSEPRTNPLSVTHANMPKKKTFVEAIVEKFEPKVKRGTVTKTDTKILTKKERMAQQEGKI